MNFLIGLFYILRKTIHFFIIKLIQKIIFILKLEIYFLKSYQIVEI